MIFKVRVLYLRGKFISNISLDFASLKICADLLRVQQLIYIAEIRLVEIVVIILETLTVLHEIHWLLFTIYHFKAVKGIVEVHGIEIIWVSRVIKGIIIW